MIHLLSLLALVAADPIVWHDDLAKATSAAIEQKKDLLIHFRADDTLDKAFVDKELDERLRKFICVRLSSEPLIVNGMRTIRPALFKPMRGKAGICIVRVPEEKDKGESQVISAFPQEKSRHDWVPVIGAKQIAIILDLPPKATLSQRSLIYAITVHPDGPKSVQGTAHAAFLEHAATHTLKQATEKNLHHADLEMVIKTLSEKVGGLRGMEEVVAEALAEADQVQEAGYSAVNGWRQSPPHWTAIMASHKYYGYDLARGSNDRWYATGIFGD